MAFGKSRAAAQFTAGDYETSTNNPMLDSQRGASSNSGGNTSSWLMRVFYLVVLVAMVALGFVGGVVYSDDDDDSSSPECIEDAEEYAQARLDVFFDFLHKQSGCNSEVQKEYFRPSVDPDVVLDMGPGGTAHGFDDFYAVLGPAEMYACSLGGYSDVINLEVVEKDCEADTYEFKFSYRLYDSNNVPVHLAPNPHGRHVTFGPANEDGWRVITRLAMFDDGYSCPAQADVEAEASTAFEELTDFVYHGSGCDAETIKAFYLQGNVVDENVYVDMGEAGSIFGLEAFAETIAPIDAFLCSTEGSAVWSEVTLRTLDCEYGASYGVTTVLRAYYEDGSEMDMQAELGLPPNRDVGFGPVQEDGTRRMTYFRVY